jgi:PhnB protein
MITSNIYLTFNGNCEEAFNYYKSIFGGDFFMIGRQKDLPSEYTIKPGDEEKIYHICLPISKETCLQGADYTDALSHREIVFGNNFSINININSPTGEDEITNIYTAFAKDGKILMPLSKVFWGGLYGVVVDKFGITWAFSGGDDNAN